MHNFQHFTYTIYIDNYRGVAIPSSVPQLYSLILLIVDAQSLQFTLKPLIEYECIYKADNTKANKLQTCDHRIYYRFV